MSAEQLYTDDSQREPFYLIDIVAGEGIVVTRTGRFTIDEAAHMMVDYLTRFDWQEYEDRDRADQKTFDELCDAVDDLFSIVTLVAQINLYQARLLWCLNAPASVGLPRMLDKSSEAQELEYHKHLAALRARQGDEVTEYVLEKGDEIFSWESQRFEFVTRGAEYVARLAAAA